MSEANRFFVELVAHLQMSAWVQLGKVADPHSGKVERNLPAAKYSIDLLGMLEEKTRGNLAAEEAELVRELLMNLRLNYVEELKKSPEPESSAT